jgi:serine phosphatase RsbU (regulator of sigma subunit)
MTHSDKTQSTEEILRQHQIIAKEADAVLEKDKSIVRGLLGNFYDNHLNVGIGAKEAYGSILSGDYFELIKLPDNNYLFVFADISGHGLPAYTTLVRLRSAIMLAVREAGKSFELTQTLDAETVVRISVAIYRCHGRFAVQ